MLIIYVRLSKELPNQEASSFWQAPRRVRPHDWRPLMSDTREAAGRLAQAGEIEVTQKGKVVDVATAKGPIRLRLRDPGEGEDAASVAPQ